MDRERIQGFHHCGSALRACEIRATRKVGIIHPHPSTSIHLSRTLHISFFNEGTPKELRGGKWEYIVEERSTSPTIQDVESVVIQKDHTTSTSARVIARPDLRLLEKPIFSEKFPQDDDSINREYVFARDREVNGFVLLRFFV